MTSLPQPLCLFVLFIFCAQIEHVVKRENKLNILFMILKIINSIIAMNLFLLGLLIKAHDAHNMFVCVLTVIYNTDTRDFATQVLQQQSIIIKFA